MGSSKDAGSRKRSRDRSSDRHKSRKSSGVKKERKSRTVSRSSSATDHERKSTKTPNKKKRHSSTSSSSNSSSSSSSDSESTKRSKRKAAKAERKERKRLRKAKKKRRESQRSVDKVILVSDPLPASAITEDNKKDVIGPDPKMMQRHSMKPMSKEEWDKQQSVLRHVYDPESGRTRLIKGDGEVMEEIVTYEQHQEINKKATEGDGATFQAKLGLQKKTLFNRTKMTSSTTKKKKSS